MFVTFNVKIQMRKSRQASKTDTPDNNMVIKKKKKLDIKNRLNVKL